ncbi:50S ribosomal protein L33 [Blochmannia endosymbiont of Polyrhachis (Hedomyrma) turneri]|uniref:50S ribosomal protein L33 n=1 Tax=Blochmannia endosymbiont of Polyrhachis (Hedomyrma) turneri TaxID=1505596 RepID=UPI00061A6974|nr:50S ribosomal protein L33 [Blochmannia endosymbiont of Polyrhachis (Hedomyrma) turneri]AKC60165.1 50S ribosomal protein L33 [Blochmannia endosymbiont of Polyrhachis (Hedomyrma) turneri]
MVKGTRGVVRLYSSAGTGHFYSIVKSKRGPSKKIELKKFDPTVRKHVVYVEGK